MHGNSHNRCGSRDTRDRQGMWPKVAAANNPVGKRVKRSNHVNGSIEEADGDE